MKKIFYGLEALWELTIAKAIIIFFPFHWWKNRCGYFQCESLKENLHNTPQLFYITRTITFVSRYLPWKSLCLDQALAAQRMLSRRHFTHTLYLGMTKKNPTQWTAHAWIRCGNQWIIGYQNAFNYTVVGTYAWLGK